MDCVADGLYHLAVAIPDPRGDLLELGAHRMRCGNVAERFVQRRTARQIGEQRYPALEFVRHGFP
jgi:hypothetical protein